MLPSFEVAGSQRDCYVCHRGKWVWVTRHVAWLSAWDYMHHCDQKSEVWLQRRKLRLTASQIATAIGINPYETRNNLIQQYAGVGSGAANKFTGNDATRHGERYEDEAIALYEKLHNKTVLCFGLMPFAHYGDFLGGSVDGITCDGVLVEVKCPYRRKPKKDSIPPYYMPQVQSMMHGFGLIRSDFVEYVPECTFAVEVFNVHDIPRDAEFMSTNYALLREFWHRVSLCRRDAGGDCLYEEPKKRKRCTTKREHRPMQLAIKIQLAEI